MERDKKGRFIKGHKGLEMEKNPMWKGGRFLEPTTGYIRIAVGKKKYNYEHRLVMEKHIGRKLRSDETVHHINGNKTDNRIENLELCNSEKEHQKNYHQPVWINNPKLNGCHYK